MKHYVRTLAAATLFALAVTGTADAAAARSGPTSLAIAAVTRGSAVAYDSINKVYLVVGGSGLVFGRFVQGDGTPLGGPFKIQASVIYTHFPRVAFSPDADGGAGAFLVTWSESDLAKEATSVHVRLVSYPKGGPVGTDTRVGNFPMYESGNGVAYATGSREFLVVWKNLGTNDVAAARIDNDGAVIGQVVIPATPDGERDPNVAYNPTTDQFLIVYSGYNNVYAFVAARRVQAGTGAVLDADRITLMQTAGTYITDVSYNPRSNQFLAAWYALPGGAMFGRLVNADGTLPGTIVPLSARYKAYDALSVAYNRWSDTFLMSTHGTTAEDAAVEITSDGIPVDNGFIATAAGGTGNFYPRLAASWDEPNWLLSTANNFTSTMVQLAAGTSAPGAPFGGGDGSPPPPPKPRLAADQSSLAFGTISGAPQLRTSPQSLRLTQTGTGTITWTASTSAAWLQISPTAGTGSSVLTVSLVASAIPATSSSGTLTITATGASNTIGPITVSLTVLAAATSKAPVGAVDSPADNVTGVTGSMAMTGWAIDDVDVTRVRILRDPVAGEAPGLVYLGDAMLVEGARPDVAAVFLTNPQSARAGWGYLLLTNMLPALGNGTFKFYAYADDADGHSTLLGTRTVTCANTGAMQPFGAIDTPAPGETVTGSVYTSYGWVLARAPRRADVPGGGTVSVVIDGTVVGSPNGWAGRLDLQALFPLSDYPGISFALGAFDFDTTTLSNGMHTMAWVVTDNEGNAAGVGSRYFRVFNGGSSQVASVTGAGSLNLERDTAGAVADTGAIEARRGYASDVPFVSYEADAAGRVTLQSEELDRIELQTHGATHGYLVTRAGLRPLPIGSRLDPVTGAFVWQPGVGFIGSYDLAFVRHAGGRLVRQDVRIVLNPKGSNRIGPQIVVDSVGHGQVVAGWAADLDSHADRGIDLIHVWAYPVAGGHPVFVGEASYGGERPDVAAIYGERFHATGFGIRVQGLEPGTYDLTIFAWSTAKHGWLPAKVVRIVGPSR